MYKCHSLQSGLAEVCEVLGTQSKETSLLRMIFRLCGRFKAQVLGVHVGSWLRYIRGENLGIQRQQN